MPFAPMGENTFGLSIIREVWQTEAGEEVYWKYYLPDVVQIFAMTNYQEAKIVAVSEFQPGVGTNYLHLPGETMEPNETPLQTAERGLLEETGYKATTQPILLSSIMENSSRSDRLVHCVLILSCEKIQKGEKDIQVVLLSPSQLWYRIFQYFTANRESNHGGGNTLKTVFLAFNWLGLFTIKP